MILSAPGWDWSESLCQVLSFDWVQVGQLVWSKYLRLFFAPWFDNRYREVPEIFSWLFWWNLNVLAEIEAGCSVLIFFKADFFWNSDLLFWKILKISRERLANSSPFIVLNALSVIDANCTVDRSGNQFFCGFCIVVLRNFVWVRSGLWKASLEVSCSSYFWKKMRFTLNLSLLGIRVIFERIVSDLFFWWFYPE